MGWVVVVVIGCLVAYIWSLNTTWGIISLVVGSVLLGSTSTSKKCGICGNLLKKTMYEWKIEGKKKKVCPHCNSSLERRQSREAMRRLK